MTRDRSRSAGRHARRALRKHEARTSGSAILILAALLMSLIGCGPTPAFMPASVLTPTIDLTAVSTASPVPPLTITPGVTTTYPPSPGTLTSVPTSTLPPPTLTTTPLATPEGGTAPATLTEVTVTIDNVTVTVRTPYMPDSSFIASGSVATSSRLPPLEMFQVSAVPFGTLPLGYSNPEDPLPPAGPGLADVYRTKIRASWLSESEDGISQSGPTATLFGQAIVGDTYLVERVGTGSEGKKPVLVVEWITEAGPRLWIVSIQQEQPEGTKDLTTLQPFLDSLEQLEISSDNLENPSSLPSMPDTGKSKQPASPTSTTQAAKGDPSRPSAMPIGPDDPETLFFPPWWNHNGINYQCNNYPGRYPASAPLQGSNTWMNMTACGPGDPAYQPTVDFREGGLPGQRVPQYEWQCAELSKRFLRLRFNINPYSAHGYQMVDHYASTANTSNPNGPDLEVVRNSTTTPHPAPQPGDILSYAGGSFGHTSVVKEVYVTGNGSGTIKVIQENHPSGPESTLSVSNWNVSAGVTGWLVGDQHYQPAAERNQDGRLEVFARGRDGNLWHVWQNCPNGWGCAWSSWASLGQPPGGPIKGNPAVVRQQNGVLEVFVRQSEGYIYKRWQVCPGCGWANWERLGTSVRFQGSPAAIVNGSHHAYAVGWGADNQIWYSWRNYNNGNGFWSDWIAIPSIATANPSVALDNRDPGNSRVTVFHRGTNMAPYYSQQSCSSCGFGGWVYLGGELDSVPAVGTTHDGRIIAFGLGTDASGVMYRNSQQWNGTWGGWVSIGGAWSRGPVVGADANNYLEVYAVQAVPGTYQNKLFRKTQLDGWNSWVEIGSYDWHVGLPGVGLNQDGRLELFARHDDRAMRNMWQNFGNRLTWGCCGNFFGEWP